jgi:hypothetical protein
MFLMLLSHCWSLPQANLRSFHLTTPETIPKQTAAPATIAIIFRIEYSAMTRVPEIPSNSYIRQM